MKHSQFISCDWGTSNFRLRLVDSSTLQLLAEVRTDDGIAKMNSRWTGKEAPVPASKEAFFIEFLAAQIRSLSVPAQQVPVVISGMASSSIGIRELAYSALPFPVNGNTIIRAILEVGGTGQPVLLLSGVRSNDDVMRGEETQVIGLVDLLGIDTRDPKVFILPGTHSKHILIANEMITKFQTYMTGEMFALLGKQSILKNSIQAANSDSMHSSGIAAFRDGVTNSHNRDLLHTMFKVRTNQLFNKWSPADNYWFLSGLLIGSELRGQVNEDAAIVLAGEPALLPLYELAIYALNDRVTLQVIPSDTLDKALLSGHLALLNATLTT